MNLVVEVMLSSDDEMEAFATDSEPSRQHHVDSVPFFIVNKEMTLSGAQSSEAFLEAFRLARGSA